MNVDTPENKRALDELMNVVPSSSIPLTKETPEAPKIPPDVNNTNQEFWGSKSNRLLNDYKYGVNLARFGENDLTTRGFFKRLSASLCATISNEFQKRGTGAEHLKPYYNILESCLLLMSKEIDKSELKEYDVQAIIASLNGFITNYNKRKESK